MLSSASEPAASSSGEEKASASTHRDGPLQRDEGADDAEDHELAVHVGEPVEPDRRGHAQQQERPVEPGEHGEPGGREQHEPQRWTARAARVLHGSDASYPRRASSRDERPADGTSDP